MLDVFSRVKRIHLVGIGGSGMSGIAEVLLNLGYNVSGSDVKDSDVIRRLKKLGAKIVIGHKNENVKDVDVVVFSSAIKPTNPELLAARKLKIPVIPRIEMLAEIARMKYTISVCGTHGKTTTTSMLGLLLDCCGYDPTIVVGGKFKNIGSSAKLGKGKFIVIESDESDGSFLRLSPYSVICTNIDNDHLDNYKSMNMLKEAFLRHFNSVPFYGFNILYGDDINIKSILQKVKRKFYTYGIEESNTFYAKNIIVNPQSVEYDIYSNGSYIGKIKLRVTGIHNVLNALAVVSFGLLSEISFKEIKSALSSFLGVDRRLEYKGTIVSNGKKIDIYDDYGHHPTEIYFTLEALRVKAANRKLVVIFQPHRYTRTKLLYKEFPKAFSKLDKIFLTEIYPASEKPIPGVSSKLIYDELKSKKFDVEMFSKSRLLKYIKNLQNDCVVLTLGAGDVYKLAEWLIDKYGTGNC
ncbi:MAG: UDP-N-acetylmuramate--L-alanine ligase [Elusimicrobiota bacterium]|nr:UDP-N-acetylmuramate--L-alanine ligase [Endomicrobiia bacterium]MDW8055401.1 UDP-N-acetylmuramate--L-alanine ligase [Elusimicrobiota bacterium]